MPMTATERDAIMATLIDTGGAWDPAGLYIGVYESIVDQGLATDMDDVTEPTGDLGDRQAVTTWAGPDIKTDGAACVSSPARRFSPADYTEGTTIQGVYVADAAADGNLLFWWPIATPIELPDETTAVYVVLRLFVDPYGNRWLEPVVYNG